MQLTLDADAAARAHVGARPRRRALERFAAPLGSARRGHARGRAGRFHAPPAGDVARRARRAHRIVQHDDVAAGRSAAEDRRIARAPRKRRAPISKASSATCPPGVLAFDDRYRLRTANPSAAVILQQPLAELIGLRSPSGAGGCRRSRSFAELVAEGFRGPPRRPVAEARRRSTVAEPDAHAADARDAAARQRRCRAMSWCSTTCRSSCRRSATPHGRRSRAGLRTRSRIR